MFQLLNTFVLMFLRSMVLRFYINGGFQSANMLVFLRWSKAGGRDRCKCIMVGGAGAVRSSSECEAAKMASPVC